MMEKFKTPAMFIGIQGVLSLYAAGRQTGIAVSIGGDATQFTPVDKGYAIPGASICLKLGGRDLRLNLAKLLTQSGSYIGNYGNFFDHAQNMVEKFCYVALDFKQEVESPPKKAKVEEESYELPGGEIITLKDETFRCPELLFQPSLLGNLNENNIKEGIPKLCFDTISKCDFEIHPLLYKNIVLSGGCSMLPGLSERLEKDIKELAPTGSDVKVIAADHRKNSVWIGGSILASLATFQDMWVTKEQYNEQGPSVIHKCPSA
jgi:actin-related protein